MTAYEAWVQAGYPTLTAVARTYRGVITFRTLGDVVEARTSVRTALLLQNWIGEVLARVVPRPAGGATAAADRARGGRD